MSKRIWSSLVLTVCLGLAWMPDVLPVVRLLRARSIRRSRNSEMLRYGRAGLGVQRCYGDGEVVDAGQDRVRNEPGSWMEVGEEERRCIEVKTPLQDGSAADTCSSTRAGDDGREETAGDEAHSSRRSS